MKWNIDLSVLIPLVVTVFIYLWGLLNVWRRAGRGHGIAGFRCTSFLGAILALVIALSSPLATLSDVLFSAHMVQHLFLIIVAAPLFVMSDYPLALLWALPRRWAQALARRLNRSQILEHAWQMISRPIPAWLSFTITLWVWHISALFESALRNETIHALEHLMFLFTAMLFWWVLIKPKGSLQTRSDRLHYGMAILYLFMTSLQSTILGALITFSTQPWYPTYTAQNMPWGLTPLQDQQLAGLIMWMPGGAVYTLLTIGYFAAWFRTIDQYRATGTIQHRPRRGSDHTG